MVVMLSYVTTSMATTDNGISLWFLCNYIFRKMSKLVLNF